MSLSRIPARVASFLLAATLAATLTATPTFAPVARASDEVVVRAGDTLSGISKRHGVSIPALVSLNGLLDPNRIYAGQRLRISGAATPPSPVPSAPAPAVPAAPASPSTGSAGATHTVARGENLWSIARHYRVSLSALVAANGITDPARIRAGLRLVIPGAQPVTAPAPPAAAPAPSAPSPVAAPSQAPAPVARTHTVARGDNLWSIARYYGVSLSALVAANGIGDAARIRPGMVLTLPGAAPASAPAPAPAPVASPVAAPPPAPAAPAVPSWMAAAMAQRAPIRQLIADEATAAGVPVAFALAVAWQESGWRQNVVSSAGAVGVMQLMPGTARWVGESMLGAPVNINDARDNVRAGVRLLAHYLARYNGNRDLVLAAYYQGQTAADRHGVYPVSRSYIASVTALTRMLGG